MSYWLERITRYVNATPRIATFLTILCASLMSSSGSSWASTQDMEIVYQTIALESAGEPFLGQVAVAEVIRNRSHLRKQSPVQVVKAPFQFSCWSGRQRRLTDAEIRSAKLAWKYSLKSNLTNKATHYHTVNCKPSWSRGRLPSFVIANHKFFNNIDKGGVR